VSQCRAAVLLKMALLRAASCTWQFSKMVQIIVITTIIPNDTTNYLEYHVNKKVMCVGYCN